MTKSPNTDSVPVTSHIAHEAPLTQADEIAALAKELKNHSIISFDTEFIRENTFFPSVELIQVATRTESWLIDTQAFRGKTAAGIQPLLEIFQDPSILKVLHAAQGDQECLYSAYQVVATPSFDTAVGASLCGYGDGIGLGNLLKALLGVTLKKGHARTNWAARPLPKQLLEYAHSDVEFLVAAGEKLLLELEKLGRKEWALEVSRKWENPKLYHPDPAGLATKLAKGGKLDSKSYAALLELMKWREERVRQLNLPRRWVADDQVLLDLAHVRPKSMDHLATFRGLNKGEIKTSGEKILEAIRCSAESTAPELPRPTRHHSPTTEESQTLDLIKTYVGILADREKIAIKHLMTSHQFLPLLKQKFVTLKDLIDAEVMSEGAAGLIGEEVLALLQGKRALSVEAGHVKIVSL